MENFLWYLIVGILFLSLFSAIMWTLEHKNN